MVSKVLSILRTYHTYRANLVAVVVLAVPAVAGHSLHWQHEPASSSAPHILQVPDPAPQRLSGALGMAAGSLAL